MFRHRITPTRFLWNGGYATMQKRPPSDAGTSGKQRSLIRALDYHSGGASGR